MESEIIVPKGLEVELMEKVIFDCSFLLFSTDLTPFLRADDVGYAVSQFMTQEGEPRYPVSALTEAKVARVRLDCGRKDEMDEDNLDVIFRLPTVGGLYSFEIILRSDLETFYAGSLRGADLQILRSNKNEYRIIRCSSGSKTLDYAFCKQSKRFKPCEEFRP
jgi:hypothetical protein